MDGRVDAHGHAIRILVCYPLVHVEEVAVALFDGMAAETLNRIREVQIHTQPGLTCSTAFVTHVFRVTRSDIARHEVTKARVTALQIVIALLLRDLIRSPLITLCLRYPNAAVVT